MPIRGEGGATPCYKVRAVTDSPDPTQDPNDPEFGVEVPAGIRLERPASGGVRLALQLSAGRRAVAALPRLVIVGGLLFALVEAWRHRVFVVFWFLGLPLFAWLRGPSQRSIVLGDRALELEGTGLFARTHALPRSQIARFEIGRAGVRHLSQRALIATLTDGRKLRFFIGISAGQAEFVTGGLQRWLAGVD